MNTKRNRMLPLALGQGEIKEWQAIMNRLRNLPVKNGEPTVIPVDDRANELRAIKVG